MNTKNYLYKKALTQQIFNLTKNKGLGFNAFKSKVDELIPEHQMSDKQLKSAFDNNHVLFEDQMHQGKQNGLVVPDEVIDEHAVKPGFFSKAKSFITRGQQSDYDVFGNGRTITPIQAKLTNMGKANDYISKKINNLSAENIEIDANDAPTSTAQKFIDQKNSSSNLVPNPTPGPYKWVVPNQDTGRIKSLEEENAKMVEQNEQLAKEKEEIEKQHNTLQEEHEKMKANQPKESFFQDKDGNTKWTNVGLTGGGVALGGGTLGYLASNRNNQNNQNY